MKRPTLLVLEAITTILSPHLGAFMAKAAVEGHRKKLGLAETLLSEGDVEALLKKIGLGLVVFVGAEKAERLLGEARQAARAVRAS